MVDNQPKARVVCEGETTLGFALYLDEVIASHQHVRVEYRTAAGRIDHVADGGCDLERVTQQVALAFDWPRPWKDHPTEQYVGARLEAFPSALFGEFIAEPTEAVPCLVVAEPRTGDHRHADIGGARRVAVATLE